jgi:drug/metabolite transporter (DMT)-like permease
VILVGSALLFALMALLAKKATARLPGPEVAFVRFAIGCLCCGLVATRVRFRANNKRGLLMRGVLGGTAVLGYFLAIEHLPVGVATLLNYTAPVFTALWAAALLDERLDLGTLGALAVTSAGVVLVVKATGGDLNVGIGFWQVVGLLSAVLSGGAVATIREVRRTDGSWEIFFSFCLAGALITAVPTARSWVTPVAREWGLLVAVGVISVVAQILMTYALRYATATVAGVIAQLTPVAALVAGALWLGERLPALAVMGTFTALAGVSWGAWIAAQPAGPLPAED